VDGVLVVGWIPRHVLDPLRKVGYPFVLVDYRFANEHADAVVTDNRKGMRTATEHLIKLGHQRIAFVGGPLEEGNFRERLEGYREALEAAGLEFDDRLVGELTENQERETAVLRVSERSLGTSAIVASNDLVALDVIRILSESGRKIPSEISVVGFDDIQAASYSHPPLTTMRVDKQAMGRRAAQRLLERLREPRSPSAEESVFQPELVVRQSTGPGPKA
jgi:DNA-binding LacI/PurR family transcriptional regulator